MRSVTRIVRYTGCAFAAAALATVVGVGNAAADNAAAISQQQVDAITKPGIVFIYGTYSGHVHYTTAGQGKRFSSLVQASYYCSGFVVSNVDGEATIATAGHCADKAEGKEPLISEFLNEEVQAGTLSASQATTLLQYGLTNWTVVGDSVGSPLNQEIDVYEPSAVSGLSSSTRMQATVEADRNFNNGDIALLQVHTQQPLPELQVATTEPNDGDALTAIGYPSAVKDVTDSSLDPSFETGHMNSLQTRNGLPQIQFDAGLSPGMSGGPVVNDQGQVIGINSYRNSGETQQFNFAVDLSTIRSFLSSHSVDNRLSAADKAYRAGLSDFYAGKYRESVPQFNATLNIEPAHALAQQYKSKAIQNYPKEKVVKQPVSHPSPTAKTHPVALPTPAKKSSGVPIWLIAVIAAAVVILAGGGAMFARSRRNPATASAAGGYAPPMANPATLYNPPPQAPAAPVAPQQAPMSAPQAPPTMQQAPMSAPQAPPTVQQAPVAAPAPPAAPRCPSCGTEYPPGTRFCSQDGTPL